MLNADVLLDLASDPRTIPQFLHHAGGAVQSRTFEAFPAISAALQRARETLSRRYEFAIDVDGLLVTIRGLERDMIAATERKV